jgi:hypothetical protein
MVDIVQGVICIHDISGFSFNPFFSLFVVLLTGLFIVCVLENSGKEVVSWIAY